MLASISSKKKIIIVALISCTVFACTRPKNGIEAVLAAAGSNRAELEKVIAHYENKGDSLKLKAALFLIENMDWGYSYVGEEIARYDAVFASICGVKTLPAVGAAFLEFKEEYGDNLLQIEDLKIAKDAEHITAGFLIENIDLAFEAWRNNPWSKDIPFDLFCKGVLPYRVGNEPLERWRTLFLEHYDWLRDSLRGSNDARHVMGLINHQIGSGYQVSIRWQYPFLPRYSQTIDCKVGTCEIMASIIISALRAQGIPAYKDMVPMWGNKNYGHAWAVMLDKDENPYWCYGEEDTLARKDKPIPASRLSLDSMGVKYLPAHLIIDTNKTIPKVYRILSYENHEKDELLKNGNADEILPFFRNPCVKDVTSQYLKDCKDITVDLQHIPSRVHFAYLGVFNRQEWVPVTIAKINKNQAMFNKMGQNVVYLPMAIVNKKTIPLGNPFYIHNGKIEEIKPNTARPQIASLTRKSMLFGNTVSNFNRMVRGYFEGANLPDFSDAKILHSITQAPIYMDSVSFTKPKNYRYIRYVGPPDRRNGADIAELELYTLEFAKEKKLDGKAVGTSPVKGITFDVIQDGDWDSYFTSSQKKNAWVGLDLGSEKTISKIRFCPRNDTNIIIPGNTYALFYWDGRWERAGIQKAVSNSITFEKVPSGALLWLRCMNSGRDENLFMMQNGKQVFL